MPLAAAGETTVMNSLLTGRYLSLHTAFPPSGEVTGGGYERMPVTFAPTSSPDPTVYKNAALVQFDAATTSWGIIQYFGIWDALTGGSLLAYNAVSVAKPVEIDDVARWEIGTLVVDTD